MATATDLPAPAQGLTLKYIAIGHGIQNYTCASTDATPVNTGALAVLYNVLPLYPGTPKTGISQDDWDALSSTVLYNQAIPLNLATPAAAIPTHNDTVGLPESFYQAVVADPFPEPAAALNLPAHGIRASFLAHHYFDSASSPTFNLSGGKDPAGLFFSGAKTGDVKAPSDADKGVLDTGAVDWLQLSDNGRGLSAGVSSVYRVATAGGAAQACSVSGVNANGTVFSVPYVAQYWFYG